MLIVDIFHTYYNGISNRNPTEYQAKQFKEQYLGKELTLCGHIREVSEYGTIEIKSIFKGFSEKHKWAVNYRRAFEFRLTALVTLKEKNLETFAILNRGEIVEVKGVIKSIEDPNSYPVKYPMVKENESMYTLNISITLEECAIKKIASSWLNESLFQIRKTERDVDQGTPKNESGCLIIMTLLITFIVIALF